MPRIRQETQDLLDELTPAQHCVVAMIGYATTDAKADTPEGARARAWLWQRQAVCFWLTLLGLPALHYDQLLMQAGLRSA